MDGSNKSCWLLIAGIRSDNKLTYSVDGNTLCIHKIEFPDVAMRKHIPTTLAHILDEEKAVAFSTDSLLPATHLWKSGYHVETTATICYNHSDHKRKDQIQLHTLIKTAQAKAATLSRSHLDAFERIERATKTQGAAWVLIDSKFWCTPKAYDSQVDLNLSDVLYLMDGLGIIPTSEAHFEATPKWPHFTKSS